ncbi:MAG: S41 family peptidase [Cyclobacteriaceae bacterium]
MRRLTTKLIIASTVLILSLSAFTVSDDKYFQIAKNLDIFATLFKEINTYYVDEIDAKSLLRSGIDAMLVSLDPYADFIDEEDLENYRFVTTGQYGGIGALVGKRNGKNIILMPYEGFPAFEAGLQIGDVVTEIDGQPIKDLNSTETSNLLKGKAETPVVLTIERFGQEEPFEATLQRKQITIDNVPYYGMLDDEVGYIKLADFTTEAALEVKNALKDLKDQNAKSLVLDLRGNPGGLLDEAINVSNIFIKKGAEVVSTKGKAENWNQSYLALNEAVDTEIPLVVLTGRGSASASEIVAGVMQDYDRAVLVGRRTFGKGLVQSTRPLAYNSQLKITTAKYYIPSGRCIQAIDYSLRNEDGSVGHIPDSLRVAFETQNGRTVYDGGGVNPDIEIESTQYSSVAIALVNYNHIFDYATEYKFEHESIAPAKEFSLSESEYQEFLSWLKGKEFDYTTAVERQLKQLVSSAKSEQYYEKIEDQISTLETQVKTNKEADLIKFKDEIKLLLEQEITSRYYFQRGIIESTFEEDRDLQAAVQVLKDDMQYGKLLARAQ